MHGLLGLWGEYERLNEQGQERVPEWLTTKTKYTTNSRHKMTTAAADSSWWDALRIGGKLDKNWAKIIRQ